MKVLLCKGVTGCERFPFFEDKPNVHGHPLDLYEVERKPGSFGNFYTVMINGVSRVTDGRLPLDIDRVPKGARKLSSEETENYWHSEFE